MGAGSSGRRATNRDVEIGARVREIRVAKRISQAELGRAIGVTYQQIQKYEQGVNRIEAGRMTRIATALDVPVAVLFEDEKRKQRSVPSPVDDLAVEGADRLLRAYQRITRRGARTALVLIAEYLAER